MSTTEIPVKGGVEDPNVAAFGIGTEPAPAPPPTATQENPDGEIGGSVQTATHHPSGQGAAQMSDADKQALQQAVQQVAGQEGDPNVTVPGQQPEQAPDPNDLGQQLTNWFQQQDQQQNAGQQQQTAPPEGGVPVPPPPGTPPSVPQFDPDAPIPMPVQQADGSWAFPEPNAAPPVGTQMPPAPASVQGQGQMSPVEARFLQEYGRLPSGQELDALFQVQRDIAQMDPARRAQVEQIMYGTPPQGWPQQYGPQAGQPPVPTPPVQDPFGEPDVGQYVQQAVQQAVAPIQQQNAALMAQMQQEAMARAEQERRQLVANIQAGTEEVKSKYALTDEDTERFQTQVAQSGIMNGLLSAHGDARAAMIAAMEQTMWADEGFRYREQVRSQAVQAQQAASDEARRQRAGQLAGGSGTVPRDDAPVPTTRDERHKAMAAELATHLSQS